MPIKTERNIEIRLNIKCEPNTAKRKRPNDTERNVKSQSGMKREPEAISNTWQTEKKNLVDKIVALKSEQSKLLLQKQQLEKKLSEMNAAFKSEHSKLLLQKQEFNAKMSETKNVQLELLNAKKEFSEHERNCGKIISDLQRENKTLTALVTQYKTGMTQHESYKQKVIQDQHENREFEVESIIGHKITKSGRKYLIHWKGYDSTEDSWENEANLHCPKLLNRYNRSVEINKTTK